MKRAKTKTNAIQVYLDGTWTFFKTLGFYAVVLMIVYYSVGTLLQSYADVNLPGFDPKQLALGGR